MDYPVGVNCRIGSLENDKKSKGDHYDVNCRIGSLEKAADSLFLRSKVNCRIGSLEILHTVSWD